MSAATTATGRGRFQEERWNYERTDFGLADRRERRLNHPEFKANTYQPGVYKNEYKHGAILVCLEACGAGSPVCGTESTVARRTSSGRGRSPGGWLFWLLGRPQNHHRWGRMCVSQTNPIRQARLADAQQFFALPWRRPGRGGMSIRSRDGPIPF